jgi:ABC-type cobalamin/Fe3+-siderophores transport system ATPase subunit
MTVSKPYLIGIVGPCGAGKSTLTEALDRLGYSTRHIAQEHSYVKDMWKRITNPDVLIFLQVSYGVSQKRRPMNWTEAEYNEQQRRLSHAHEYADLYLETDELSAGEVLEQVLAFIKAKTP